MSETLTYGSVRRAPGDRHPYRDPFFAHAHFCHELLSRLPPSNPARDLCTGLPFGNADIVFNLQP